MGEAMMPLFDLLTPWCCIELHPNNKQQHHFFLCGKTAPQAIRYSVSCVQGRKKKGEVGRAVSRAGNRFVQRQWTCGIGSKGGAQEGSHKRIEKERNKPFSSTMSLALYSSWMVRGLGPSTLGIFFRIYIGRTFCILPSLFYFSLFSSILRISFVLLLSTVFLFASISIPSLNPLPSVFSTHQL